MNVRGRHLERAITSSLSLVQSDYPERTTYAWRRMGTWVTDRPDKPDPP
jgi:hypothetical protein